MATSYLLAQKEKLFALVGALEEELQKVESTEEISEVFGEWKKEVWRLFEEGLKTSFANGQKAARAVSGKSEDETNSTGRKRFANWRSRVGQGDKEE